MGCRCEDPFEDALDDRSTDLRGLPQRARDLLASLDVRLRDPESPYYGVEDLAYLSSNESTRTVARARNALEDRLGASVDSGDLPGGRWACDRLRAACLVLLALDRYDLRLPEAVVLGDSTSLVAW